MRAKWLSYAIVAVALIAAGFYVFVYLYRWEWNRAIMAGVLFVAAEIALATALVLDKLRSLEKKIDTTAVDRRLHSLDAIEDAAPPGRRHFAWLGDQDGVGVFVPVLMGAGIVISGIACAVERIAASTARPLLERRLAARLQPLALPAGGLTGTAALAAPLPPNSRRATIKRVFVVLAIGAALALSIDVLGDLTQNRPDAITAGKTTLVLDLSIKDADLGSPAAAATSLWMACRGTVSSDLRDLRARDGHVSLLLEPALGPYSMKRLNGCLEDGTIDGLSAKLID